MKEIIKILKLILNIFLRPKETSVSRQLVDYNYKLIIFFIGMLAVISILRSTHPNFFLRVVGVWILLFIGIKILFFIYRKILNSVITFNIPANKFKILFMPYILALQVLDVSFTLISLVLILFQNQIIQLIITQVMLLWFNYNFFLVSKYRIYNKEMPKTASVDLIKKLFILQHFPVLLVKILINIDNILFTKITPEYISKRENIESFNVFTF